MSNHAIDQLTGEARGEFYLHNFFVLFQQFVGEFIENFQK